jgi:hypothetical protein
MSDPTEEPQGPAEFQLKISQERIAEFANPKLLGPLVVLVVLIVFSFLTWVSSGGQSASGWNLGVWFGGEFCFWLSLILLVLIVLPALLGYSKLQFLVLPISIVECLALLGVFLITVLTSFASPGYGLVVDLVAGVILVWTLSRSTRERGESSSVLLLSAAIGAVFLPWAFQWSGGFHVSVSGWSIGWGMGVGDFVVDLIALVVVAYAQVNGRTETNELAGMLCLLASAFCILGFVKSFLGSSGISSTPNFGVIVAFVLQIWCARILLGRRLTSLVRIV